jgi:hypothetical protein
MASSSLRINRAGPWRVASAELALYGFSKLLIGLIGDSFRGLSGFLVLAQIWTFGRGALPRH